MITISWDGEPIGSDVKDEMKIDIPPLDEFSVVQIRADQTSGLYYSVQFSDPIDADQDLTGLISLKSNKEQNRIQIKFNYSFRISDLDIGIFTFGFVTS